MSDTKSEGIKAEALPSQSGEISALVSANAPVILFDSTPSHDGIGAVTLAARRHKGGFQAIRALKQSLEAVIGIMEGHERQKQAAARAYEILSEAVQPEPPLLKN